MDAIHEFIKQRRSLVWYVWDFEKLSEESIVEQVINYGDWDDVQEMIKILGMRRTAELFRKRSTPDKFGRQNFRPELRHYFNLYFDKYAQ